MNLNKIPEEKNNKILNNTLLYPISKAYHEVHRPYDDIINTYDKSIDNIADIIKTDKIVDEFITLSNGQIIQFILYFDNFRVFPPDSEEARQYSVFGYNPTPNKAISSRTNYCCVCISDCVYKCFTYSQKNNVIQLNTKKEIFSEIIPNSYYFSVPIPIFSKYCALRHYDKQTLIRLGEDCEEIYGYFIIESFLRYIVLIDRKPFNHELIQRNIFDEQLSRCEALYTTGFDYEDSYYVVASMVQQKGNKIGRGAKTFSPPDFIFSLQLNDKAMNIETNFNKKSHKLINAVPIKFMFYAFGCTSDLDILKYINPEFDNFGLIQCVRNACLSGYKHLETLEFAGIKTRNVAGYVLIDEPLTKYIALYIIGVIILNEETKSKILENARKNAAEKIGDKATDISSEYRVMIALKTLNILEKRFMPGIGMYNDDKINRNHAICIEMGQIVKRLYMIGNQLEASQDKTSLINKRVRSGQQIEKEIKSFHSVRLREIMEEVRKIFTTSTTVQSVHNILLNKLGTLIINAGKNMSTSIINSFKGTSKEQSKLRTNLATLKNQGFVDTCLREIVKSPNTKMVGSDVSWEHREVHQTELFYIDPIMTPEAGRQTGRYKSPTIYTELTLPGSGKAEFNYISKHPKFIRSIYDEKGNISANPVELYNVKINGNIIGYVRQFNDVDEMFKDLMAARISQKIDRYTSIILNHNNGNLSIWTDTGRIMSPFVNVSRCFSVNVERFGDIGEKSKIKAKITIKPDFKNWLKRCAAEVLQYNEGLNSGFIELIDPEMAINNCIIAPTIRDFYECPHMYTHIALPQHIYSVVCSMVPSLNMNKAVRGSLISNHVKQMIGPTIRYPQLKYKDEQHMLIAPQIPICRTCSYDHLHFSRCSYGQNIIIAFMYYKYNQEDSVIVNKASVESGLLQIDTITTKVSEINRDEEFKIADNTVLHGNSEGYQKLDPNTCLPKNISEKFRQHDPLIAKIIKTQNGNNDVSVINEQPDGKYLKTPNDRMLRCVSRNRFQDINQITKMAVFGQYQTLIVGDKCNFETAQKVTIGSIFSPEKIPYTRSGIRPDVIFNPPSIFKRVTYSQLYMAYLGKIAALLGCPIDTTPFYTQRSTEDLLNLMKSLGLEESGEEVLYDPETGRPFRSKIFVGCIYMGRQPHIVERKMNIRNGGPKSIDTQQPTKGRKRGGGQSLDRMSQDTFAAAGINGINRDAHLEKGSKMLVAICNECHSMKTYFNEQRQCWICPQCGAHSDFELKYIPIATNIINHILNGLHVSMDYFA